MSLEVIRYIARIAAAGAIPFVYRRGGGRAEIILGTCAVIEVLVRCKDEVIAAQPPAKAIVARTLEALEAEQEREAAADLPRIAEGRRQ